MTYIALALNSVNLEDVQPYDYETFEKYPGSGFIGELKTFSLGTNFDIISSTKAYSLIKQGYDSSRILVVQEEMCERGKQLIHLGCVPFVNYCMESKLYAGAFYSDIIRLRALFKHTFYFDGGSEQLYFPSYGDADNMAAVPWHERKFLCQVMSNKWVQTDDQYSLQPYRKRAMDYWLQRPDFHLYGNGFNPIVKKLDVIRNYKFTLCFENYESKGYITEKIIHALVAGVVPIYMGALDVEKFITPSCFIDAFKFPSFEDMEKYLRTVSPKDMWDMVRAGKSVLRAYLQKWHYNYLAIQILKLASQLEESTTQLSSTQD